MKKFISILLSAAMLAASVSAFADEYKKVEGQNGILYSADSTMRNMEKLDRGLFVQNSNGVNYLSWRLFAEEDAVYGTAENNVSFRIYKNGEPYAEETATTNYTDRKGKTTDTYQVAPIVDGVEGEKCEAVKPNNGIYFDIPLVKPEAETIITPSGQTVGTFNFSPTDASAGDLDGDGEYEIVVKWVSSEHDVGSPGDGIQSLSGTVRFAAYKLDGTKMWTQDINLGKNVYSSAHTVQFLVYDFDGDGKAEMMCQTSVGSKDAEGNYVSKAAKNDTSISGISDTTNANTDYRTDWGPVKTGKEFLTVFNGETGAAMDTIDLPTARGTDQGADFGDTSGNRSNRFVASVAYLDGVKPYAVYLRGYYFGRTGKQRTSIAGVSFDGEKLSADYRFDTQNGQPGYYNGAYKYVGQGNHNCTVADVDNDGKDEFLTGALCMEVDDQNRFRPRWCTYKEHGDALHIGNYDPTNNFFEFFTVHEDGDKDNKEGDYGYTNDQGVRCDFGMSVINAETGDIVFHKGNTKDTGRGIMADVGAGGYYQFAGVGTYRSDGGTNFVSESYGLSVNFRVFWDGDLYDELLDGTSVTSWDNNSKKMNEIFNAGGYDCVSVNGTKANPSLQADLFGDWREELVYPTRDGNNLRVFSTNIATKYKLKTLMSDGMYRSGAAAEQTCYNQPPHVSMYMGEEIFDNLIIPTPVPTPTPEGLTYAELVHTATSKWGSWGNNSGTSYDNEKEFMNNDVDNAWSGAAYAQFKLPDDTITNAELTFTVLGESKSDRTFKVYMSDSDIDLTKLSVSSADLFRNSRKDISSGTFTAPKNAERAYTVNVTDLLEGKNGKTVTFIFTENEGGGDLYGKQSQMAPVLELMTVKPTPTPTPSPTPTPTPTPTPSPTPIITPTPAIDVTTEPTSEPTPTIDVTTEPTSAPTPTPEATTEPTSAPTPTPTTEPTSAPTPTPEVTAEPTSAPTPTPTTEPTSEPLKYGIEILSGPQFTDGTLSGAVTVRTAGIGQAKLILAVYDENGSLKYVRIKDSGLSDGEITFDSFEIKEIKDYSYSVFAWKDLTGMDPICMPAKK